MFWYKPKAGSFSAYFSRVVEGLVNCCNSYVKTQINPGMGEIDFASINTEDSKTVLQLILLQLALMDARQQLNTVGHGQMFSVLMQALTPSPEAKDMQKEIFDDFKKRKKDDDEGNWWKNGTEPAV